MRKNFFITLVVMLIAAPICADQDVSSKDIEVMVERYVLGMGNVAKKLLSDSGMAQSDVNRI